MYCIHFSKLAKNSNKPNNPLCTLQDGECQGHIQYVMTFPNMGSI